MVNTNTRAELDRLLQTRNQHPEQAAEIDAKIQAIFAETHAILIMDTAGFSRLTLHHGIISFLAALRELCAIAIPLITQHQGTVIKQEADDIFAVFPDVNLAVNAAIAILKNLAVLNWNSPDHLELQASFGIGYGEVLMIEGKDMFGSEMNLACKLGEDLARPSEILLTEAAFRQLQTPSLFWERLEFSVSGLVIVGHKLRTPVSWS